MMTRFCYLAVHPCDRTGEYCPGPDDIVAHYTQIMVNGTCCIPDPKPDCVRLIGKYPSIKLHKVEEVETVEFVHDRLKKGKKVVVAGSLEIGFEYIAVGPQQKVHYFPCCIPFTAIILRCHRTNHSSLRPFHDCFSLSNYLVHACLEHLKVVQTSPRCVELKAVLMIWMQHIHRRDSLLERRREKRWTFVKWNR